MDHDYSYEDAEYERIEAEAIAKYAGRNYLTPEEGKAEFDAAVRKYMGMSGEEFICRWESGEYDEIYDKAGHRHIGFLAGLIPLARQDA